MTKYYVYAHLSGIEVRYVGCGVENRPFDFFRRNSEWKNLFCNTHPPKVVILAEFEDRKEAEDHEKSFIVFFKNLGHRLVNRPVTRYWLGKKRSEIDPETMEKLWRAGHTPEAIEKRRQALTGRSLTDEHKKKIADAQKGRIQTETTKKKISQSKKGRPNGLKGTTRSNDLKQKMSSIMKSRMATDTKLKEALKNRKRGWTTCKAKAVLCIDTGLKYRSAGEAAKELGLSDKNIQACCTGKKKSHGGYSWKYVES